MPHNASVAFLDIGDPSQVGCPKSKGSKIPVYPYSIYHGRPFPIGPDGRYQYPKHTAAELRAIYKRNPCPEVRELLWEIHRLQVLLLRANQLQKTYGGGCHASHIQILETFRAELRGLPCIEEREAWEREFFGPPTERLSVYSRNRKRSN